RERRGGATGRVRIGSCGCGRPLDLPLDTGRYVRGSALRDRAGGRGGDPLVEADWRPQVPGRPAILSRQPKKLAPWRGGTPPKPGTTATSPSAAAVLPA